MCVLEQELVLASGSPRRRELLALAGVRFEVIPSIVDEDMPGEEPAEAYVLRLAEAKARDVASRLPAADCRPVLGADTMVTIDGHSLGKPADATEAERMLRQLSGRVHQVITGVCLLRGAAGEAPHERKLLAVSTQVRFRTSTEAEVADYLACGEWQDKAGAYAIQGRAAAFVDGICGSYTNVVGLPLSQVLEMLRG